MSQEKVFVVHGVLDRWIIQPVHSPQLAWSGSQWVEHSGGIGFTTQVSNFESIKDATAYASSFEFEVVGIERGVNTVVIDGVEYVPKDTIISPTLFDNLKKAYSEAFGLGVYDPTCNSELCRQEWLRFYHILKDINKELGFKR